MRESCQSPIRLAVNGTWQFFMSMHALQWIPTWLNKPTNWYVSGRTIYFSNKRFLFFLNIFVLFAGRGGDQGSAEGDGRSEDAQEPGPQELRGSASQGKPLEGNNICCSLFRTINGVVSFSFLLFPYPHLSASFPPNISVFPLFSS